MHDSLLLGRAASEVERHAVQEALISGNAQSIRAVQSLPGIQRISRESVVRLFVAHKLLPVEDLEEFEVQDVTAREVNND